MRVVFLFFLLLNAVYFYLHSDLFSDKKGPVILKQQKLPEGANRLTLLRERGIGGAATLPPIRQNEAPGTINTDQQSSESASEPGKQDTTTRSVVSEKIPPPFEPIKSTAMACFTLGPFTTVSSASRAAKAISALGVIVKRRQILQREPRGYWVYLPSFKSYNAAKRQVRVLQKKGFKDLFIMGKGENKNAVSLGLFNTRDAAEERFDQVKSLGLDVKMETQYRENKQAWLDMAIQGDRTSTVADLTAMAEKYRSASLAQHKCK
jgi:cell division septation protein DedD